MDKQKAAQINLQKLVAQQQLILNDKELLIQ